MKFLKLLLIFALVIGASFSGNAQRYVKVYPAHGTVVTKVYHPRVVHHRGINFRFAAGVWYKPVGTRYVVTAAPAGVRVRFLPRGYRIVRVNGRKYYRYNGTWYKKSGRYYKVVYV